jgi:F0F1-type ATP synthase assembly protein I
MIDGAAIRRLTVASAIVLVLAASFCFALWPPKVAIGLLAGGAIGLIPFLSWALLARCFAGTAGARALGLVALVAKLGLYAALFYALVTRELVNPAGVMAGITLVAFTFALGALAVPQRAREVRV